MTTTVIGFVGFGDVPDRLLRQMLADQVDAAHGDVRFVIPMRVVDWSASMEFVAEWALANKVSYEVIVDSKGLLAASSERMLPLSTAAARMTEAVDVHASLSLVLERASPSKLLVFWHPDDDDAIRVVARAQDYDIEVRDLCDVLTLIGRLPITKEEAVAVVDDPQIAVYAYEDLEALVADEDGHEVLAGIAELYGIDHAVIDTWEEVRDLVWAAQEAALAEPGEEAEAEAGLVAPGIEEPVYPVGKLDRAALEAMSVEQIDEVIRANKVPVYNDDGSLALRARLPRKIKAILDFQDLDDEPVPEPEAVTYEALAARLADFGDLQASATAQILGALEAVSARQAALEEAFGALGRNVDSQYEVFTAGLEENRKLIDKLSAPRVVSPVKAASIAKRAPLRVT